MEDGSVIDTVLDIALLDCLRENKTEFAEPIALEILSKKEKDSNWEIPSKIKELFVKINEELKFNT